MSDQDLTPEQRQLLAQVAATESAIGADTIDVDDQGNPKAPEPAENPAEENKVILQTLLAILTPAMPFLKDCYPPEVIERIAYAYTAVEEKYGWNVRGLMGVEVQLAIVAIPPTIQAVILGRLYFEQRRRDAEKVINPEGQGDGSNE